MSKIQCSETETATNGIESLSSINLQSVQYSLNKYVLRDYYVSGTLPGIKAINKTLKNTCPRVAYNLVEGNRQKKK